MMCLDISVEWNSFQQTKWSFYTLGVFRGLTLGFSPRPPRYWVISGLCSTDSSVYWLLQHKLLSISVSFFVIQAFSDHQNIRTESHSYLGRIPSGLLTSLSTIPVWVEMTIKASIPHLKSFNTCSTPKSPLFSHSVSYTDLPTHNIQCGVCAEIC